MAIGGRALRILVVGALAVGLAAPAHAAGTLSSISRSATASALAQPGAATQAAPAPSYPSVDNPALVGCDAGVLQRLVASDPAASQWVIVSVPSASATSGTLSVATVSGDHWVCTIPATPAMVGRSGVRPLVLRRSGDDTTPAGVFPLGVVAAPGGPVTFFGNLPDPGVHGAYRRLRASDCYGANPNTAGYGHWRSDVAGCTGDDERLATNTIAYEHAVLIGANTEPDVSGDAPGEPAYAAAIFLHRTTLDASGRPKPTSGCVSIGHDPLVATLRALDPALSPRFAIGARTDLLATAPRNALPQR
jgi:L,D-peptidoglycan transpeptidase YkuD (ErfK/YbiS/YcfS/YnhG family)